MMSIPAFFLDLEAITKVISLGVLITYSIVTACGIALRFRERATQTSVRSSNEVYVWLYILSAFALAYCLVRVDNMTYKYITAAITFALLIVMQLVP